MDMKRMDDFWANYFKAIREQHRLERHMSDDISDAQDALRDKIDELEAENNKLREALAFARSVIKSGEDWSETCERIINGALQSA